MKILSPRQNLFTHIFIPGFGTEWCNTVLYVHATLGYCPNRGTVRGLLSRNLFSSSRCDRVIESKKGVDRLVLCKTSDRLHWNTLTMSEIHASCQPRMRNSREAEESRHAGSTPPKTPTTRSEGIYVYNVLQTDLLLI